MDYLTLSEMNMIKKDIDNQRFAILVGSEMCIRDSYDFKEWMQKLFDKLDELCKDVRILRNADKVLSEDDNLLDNQDLCLLFKVSIRTLQRLRSKNELPYMLISGKVYYRASDVRKFIKERFNAVMLRNFEKQFGEKK